MSSEPEPSGGFYKEWGVETFIRKLGYPDKNDKPERLNFGGVHRAGERQPSTGLTMQLTSSARPVAKKRSQFHMASKNIAAFYETVEVMQV